MTSVYFIRHAQAQGNVEQRFQGSIDLPLTPLGQNQIKKLALRMRAIPLTAVYTSPLRRAFETAAGLAAPHGLAPVPHQGIIELDGGDMENRTFEELRQLYSVEYRQFVEEPHLFQGVGGGESMRQVYERMIAAVEDIVSQNPGGNLALVSHGAALRCYLCYATGTPLERMNELAWAPNTSVSHITFNAQLQPMVHSMFDATHLEFDMLPVAATPDSGKDQSE